MCVWNLLIIQQCDYVIDMFDKIARVLNGGKEG
jgi:hypothetical protein